MARGILFSAGMVVLFIFLSWVLGRGIFIISDLLRDGMNWEIGNLGAGPIQVASVGLTFRICQ